MGGSRCYFRNCHVSSNKFARISLFHFPIKDAERYKKWRQFAKMEHMLEYTEMRQKNTSICARHFRLECFMNYKLDRLCRTAVPTLIRLPNDQALDFELDIENGVLITLEKTKFKHLMPPSDFESPLQLENDKLLMNILNDVQGQRSNVDLREALMDVGSDDNRKDCENESLVNSVQILETIQVLEPKRAREDEEHIDERPGVSSVKKFKIRNDSYGNGQGRSTNNETIVECSSMVLQDEDIEWVTSDNDLGDSEKTPVLMQDEALLVKDNNLVITEEDDEIEYFEINDTYDNNIHYSLTASNRDSSIEQLDISKPDESLITEALNQELLMLKTEIVELKKKNQDYTCMQVQISLLENENYELKENLKEHEQMKKKVLSLQVENNIIKRSLKASETLNDKLQKYGEENKKLKEEMGGMAILKAELLSRQEETKELKKLLETLKYQATKDRDLEKRYQKDFQTERDKNLTKENQFKNDLTNLNNKLDLKQKQLKETEHQLKEAKEDLNSMKIEKERLIKRLEELEQSLNNIQSNFNAKQEDYKALKSDHDNQQQKYMTLEQKFWKLQALQNQEATVTTTLEKPAQPSQPAAASSPAVSANSLTKAQLFNGIKRYLSASMVSLLRMEMFGTSEREWKNDERQVAVDILRLGETVYKYFTDEWRFRLPALRDVRHWLNQSQQMMDDEEDL